jgi:threonyl-tRNA synthetase
MRMLFIHCDYFSYLTTQPTNIAERITRGCKCCAFKDALVIFLTVEKCDEADPNKVVEKGVQEITSISKRVGAKDIVLFPFAHLSEQVGNSKIALQILTNLEKNLKLLKYSVDRAPFGWEKVFSLTSKGHPLAESSRTIRP